MKALYFLIGVGVGVVIATAFSKEQTIVFNGVVDDEELINSLSANFVRNALGPMGDQFIADAVARHLEKSVPQSCS